METREFMFVFFITLLLSIFISLAYPAGFGFLSGLFILAGALIGLVAYSYGRDPGTAVFQDHVWLLIAAIAGVLFIPAIRGRFVVTPFLFEAVLFALMLSLPPLLLIVRGRLFALK